MEQKFSVHIWKRIICSASTLQRFIGGTTALSRHSILQWAIDFLRMREKQSNITSCRPNCAISIENNDMSLFVKFTGLNFFLTTGVELYLRCLQRAVVRHPNVGHIAAFICGTTQGNFTPRWVTVPLVRLNYCQIFDGFLKKKNDIENTFT